MMIDKLRMNVGTFLGIVAPVISALIYYYESNYETIKEFHEEAIKTLEYHVASLETSIHIYKSRIGELDDEVKTLKKVIDSKDRLIHLKDKMINDKQEVIASLTSKNLEINLIADQLNREVVQLHYEIQIYKEEKSQYLMQLEAKNEELKKWELKNKLMIAENDSLKSKLDSYVATLSNSEKSQRMYERGEAYLDAYQNMRGLFKKEDKLLTLQESKRYFDSALSLGYENASRRLKFIESEMKRL